MGGEEPPLLWTHTKRMPAMSSPPPVSVPRGAIGGTAATRCGCLTAVPCMPLQAPPLSLLAMHLAMTSTMTLGSQGGSGGRWWRVESGRRYAALPRPSGTNAKAPARMCGTATGKNRPTRRPTAGGGPKAQTKAAPSARPGCRGRNRVAFYFPAKLKMTCHELWSVNNTALSSATGAPVKFTTFPSKGCGVVCLLTQLT